MWYLIVSIPDLCTLLTLTMVDNQKKNEQKFANIFLSICYSICFEYSKELSHLDSLLGRSFDTHNICLVDK